MDMSVVMLYYTAEICTCTLQLGFNLALTTVHAFQLTDPLDSGAVQANVSIYNGCCLQSESVILKELYTSVRLIEHSDDAYTYIYILTCMLIFAYNTFCTFFSDMLNYTLLVMTCRFTTRPGVLD